MNPKYLGAYDLEFDKEYTFIIERIERDIEIVGESGRKDKKPIVHIRGGKKPWILNPTNSKMLTIVLGSPFIDDWIGKPFIIKVVKEKTKFSPELIDVIRVMNKKP